MSYSPEHKLRTRKRILDSALRLFRVHGYGGVGIDAVMADAGLTRGGFYAHFASKEDLFLETTREAPERLGVRISRDTDGRLLVPEGFAKWFFDFYFSREHRDGVATGCGMPPLAAEVSRADDEVRSAFTSNLGELIDALTREAPGEDRCRTLAALALGVGSVVLARAVNDEEFGYAILSACETVAREQMQYDEVAPATARFRESV